MNGGGQIFHSSTGPSFTGPVDPWNMVATFVSFKSFYGITVILICWSRILYSMKLTYTEWSLVSRCVILRPNYHIRWRTMYESAPCLEVNAPQPVYRAKRKETNSWRTKGRISVACSVREILWAYFKQKLSHEKMIHAEIKIQKLTWSSTCKLHCLYFSWSQSFEMQTSHYLALFFLFHLHRNIWVELTKKQQQRKIPS